GAGPGEISGLEDFALGAGGVVAVLDNQNGRLSLFGQDGEFRGSFSVPIYFGMDFLPDGRMVLFPSRHDGALDVYTRDGSRSSIGRAEDLPYVCTDRLEPGPDCRSKIPCMLCNVAVLAPDRIALVDQFQARVLLLDSDGGVRRTL